MNKVKGTHTHRRDHANIQSSKKVTRKRVCTKYLYAYINMYLEATRVHVHFFEIPSMAKIDAIEKKQNGGEQVTAA
jgi:hypothetical protein